FSKSLFLATLFWVFSFIHNAGACVSESDHRDDNYPLVFKGSDDPNFEEALENLGGLATFNDPDVSYPGNESVKDRILDGFEVALPLTKLSDGTMLFWGFKYKEATYKSIAIADGSGRLCLVGAVTNVI